MSTQRFKRLREEDAVWDIGFLFLDREEMLLYNENPDLYVAQTQGFDTVKDFFEFEDSHGAARCGGVTKAGKPCRAVIKFTSDPREWQSLHRKARCRAHVGQSAQLAQIAPSRKGRSDNKKSLAGAVPTRLKKRRKQDDRDNANQGASKCTAAM